MGKEIGGYLEIEEYRLPMLHEKAISLNFARNCLVYLLKKKNIKKIYIPKFLCDSVEEVCRKENVIVQYYSIGIDFFPKTLNLLDDEWIYIVNYYGQLTNDKLCELLKQYRNVIIDNVQAYFQKPLKEVDTIYTCRKFLGVSDGAFLYSNIQDDYNLEIDESYSRMKFLLGRYERTASEFYTDYTEVERKINSIPIKRMSRLTYNLLHGIDYEFVKERRTQNFEFLHGEFRKINKLNLIIPEGAYMYPLYVDNGSEIREKLHGKKIYVATLWPDVFEVCDEYDLEYDMAKNILPLPVDQRYTIEDMRYIVRMVKECIV